MSLAVVILAAGQGTRMNSKIPKVLHPVAGKPMVSYSVDVAQALGAHRFVLVVGHRSEQIRTVVGATAEFVEQIEQKGTGHAVLQAREALRGQSETVMVLYGDMPLLRTETLQRLYDRQQATNACITMLTVMADDPMGFGRIVRESDGSVVKIIEESEATPAQLAIKELNCGIYCFNADWLWEHLLRLRPAPKKQEYFLTDLVQMAANEQALIETETLRDRSEVIGINTRVHLAEAEAIMRNRIRERAMLSGVTLTDPDKTYIDAEVEIGQDTVILPGTHLWGKTKIGSDCHIGPDAQVRDSVIGDRCEIGASLLEQSMLQDEVKVGPYCHLRPGTVLGVGVHLGDHAELKNARLGPGTKMGHFSYLGDAEVGARVNIGAGTITCNYDGKHKQRTVIGDDAFIGSDTMLVAPVSVGARARTGAGSVVTRDLPPDSLSVGVPARVIKQLEIT
ncbi:MAG: bifunctional UDP-N-acetylglucosamine diphosphorylase/glucosamine-1-phosphate N-acetyltransferase GlmU [Anaerolineae bacterium]